ncbi:hypothetical protein LI90_1140 [Carbonactinospora thermoautotrophica]|uniref:Uncharacterized protein n=2 Tax=Carbonactinospora thermoautotrophica TaxID=1469144 RepID=A0A132MNR1_9ACTN|nr:hypothetical protein [Carbonactinospora thermoautotrophica]KWW99504.1 hypothetical protein LI90_1140 [Carbonactinospora thermoautotrophica]
MQPRDETVMPPLWDEAEFTTLLADLAHAYAPRRFALCEVHGEREDGSVFGWGMAFDDRAVIWRTTGAVGTFESAESALTLFSRRRNLQLVWIDQGRTPDA